MTTSRSSGLTIYQTLESSLYRLHHEQQIASIHLTSVFYVDARDTITMGAREEIHIGIKITLIKA